MKRSTALLAIAICAGGLLHNVQPANAQYTGYVHTRNHPYHRPVTLHDYFSDHPKVKAATVGAGVGTAAGAVTGLVTGRGILRGSLIGAGTGAGVGLVRSSRHLRRHPIARDIATGSLVGLGLGAAGGPRHGHWGLKGAGVGAAVGMGTGILMHGL
jgi:hypothetical protein